MQKYLIAILFIIIGTLQIAYKAQKNKVKELNEKYSLTVQNLKGQSNSSNMVLRMTIEQLEYYGDSITKELNKTREELNIKNKNVQALHYVSAKYTKTDTLLLKDTIFSSPSVVVDTIVGDEWCNVKLSMRYPSYITVNPKFKSEKHIVVSTKKETIEPPKKFFLLRWFQKKHTVLKVNVIEKNPYATDERSEYVETLK